MTKPNSAGGKFNALTLHTRLQELQAENANFKIAYSKGVAIVTVQVSIAEKQYARAVKKIEPENIVDMFQLMDNIGDFVCPEDIGTTQADVDSMSAVATSLPAWTPSASTDDHEDVAAPADPVGVDDDVIDTEAEVIEPGADISIDPGLDPEQEQHHRQLAVGDKVAMLTDTSINYMVLAVGPEFAGLACLHEGIVKLTCAPVQMLGFVGDAPASAT